MTPEERFMAKVRKTSTCWLWTGYVQPNGYGMFRFDGSPQLAHRVAYVLFVGPIPEGYTIDHVKTRGCKHRHCVRPSHLEPVTLMENRRRGNPSNQHRNKTQCKNGHDFTVENTKARPNGARECKTCRRDISRRAYLRSKSR